MTVREDWEQRLVGWQDKLADSERRLARDERWGRPAIDCGLTVFALGLAALSFAWGPALALLLVAVGSVVTGWGVAARATLDLSRKIVAIGKEGVAQCERALASDWMLRIGDRTA